MGWVFYKGKDLCSETLELKHDLAESEFFENFELIRISLIRF
jgi:hypothetical protein